MIYEFYCKECEVVGEESRRVRDRDKVYHCKNCGDVCQRQMSTNSFHLKGNCWAKDNYRNKQAVPPGYGGTKGKPRGRG